MRAYGLGELFCNNLYMIVTIVASVVVAFVGTLMFNIYMSFSPKLSKDSLLLPVLDNLNGWISHVGETLGIATSVDITRFIIRVADVWQNCKVNVNVEDTTISGVPVRIYRPKSFVIADDSRPALIFFHGGGFVVYSARTSFFNKFCSKISEATQSVIISVDYRLAPEHIFPAQFQDCYSVASTVIKDSAKYGINEKKIVIGGESSGGLLAAAVSLELAKETTGNDIAAQLLLYPWLQSIDMSCLPSYQEYSRGFPLTAEHVAYFSSVALTGKPAVIEEYISGDISRYFMNTPYWKFLEISEDLFTKAKQPMKELPLHFTQTVVDQRFSPLLADSVQGLPPTLVVSAEYDVLASEGELFVRRLKKAGIPVVHKSYKTYHGFINNLVHSCTVTAMVTKAMQDMTDYLTSVFYEDCYLGE